MYAERLAPTHIITPRTHTAAVALRFLDPREWAPGTLTKADFKRREAELPTEGGLCFVGLVSLVDPPKPRVAEAVQKCKVAGVRFCFVLMPLRWWRC